MQIHELPSGTPTDSDLLPFDTGTANYKTPFSGFDVGENSATFTSADEADPSQFKTVSLVETGPIKTILNSLSMAVSNVRYIWKVIGQTVMGTTATTLTGAIKELNDKLAVTTATYTWNGKDFYFHRQGNIVTMNSPSGISSCDAGYQTLFTIAAQFRPSATLRVPRSDNTSNSMVNMFLRINTNGTVELWAADDVSTSYNASFESAYYTSNSR